MIGKVKMELKEIEFEKLTGKELEDKISNINDEANYMVFILRFPKDATFSLGNFISARWVDRETRVKPPEESAAMKASETLLQTTVEPLEKDVAGKVPETQPQTLDAPPKAGDRSYYIRTDVWTPEEDAVLLPCESPEIAARVYRERFPGSTRNQYPVEQRWYSLTRDRRRLAGVNPKGPDIPCPFCQAMYRPLGLVRHVKMAHPERYEEFYKKSLKDFVKEAEITDEGTILAPPVPQSNEYLCGKCAKSISCNKIPVGDNPCQEFEEMPATPAEDMPGAGSSQLNCDKTTVPEPVKNTIDKISPSTIVTGMHVKQIKPDRGEKVLGTLTVTARKGDLIEVRNGSGRKHWIESKCLEVL